MKTDIKVTVEAVANVKDAEKAIRSFGRAVKDLNMSLKEAIKLIAKTGVKANIRLNKYVTKGLRKTDIE